MAEVSRCDSSPPPHTSTSIFLQDLERKSILYPLLNHIPTHNWTTIIVHIYNICGEHNYLLSSVYGPTKKVQHRKQFVILSLFLAHMSCWQCGGPKIGTSTTSRLQQYLLQLICRYVPPMLCVTSVASTLCVVWYASMAKCATSST